MSAERPLRIIWTWLDWWRIDHAAVKRINYVWAPIIGVAGGVVVWAAPVGLNIFGSGGIVQQINGLIPVLAGFFVASLAAVATFSRPSLDDVMGGVAPSLRFADHHNIERLTRRRFLCILFGYLAGASIAVYVVGACAAILAPLLAGIRGGEHIFLRVIFSAFYLGAFGHVVLTSFLGLYFLIDRIHQETPPAGFLDLPSGDAGGTQSTNMTAASPRDG